MRSRRLRTRIVWSTAAISGLAMAAMVATVVLGLAAVTRSSVRSTLDDRFGVLSGAIAATDGDPATALESADDKVDDTTWLYDTGGNEVDGPRAGARSQRVADSLSGVTTRTLLTRDERVYLAAPVRVSGSSGSAGVLVVSTSLEPYEATRIELVVALVLVGLLVTAGATGIAAWTVTRTLGPVESMAGLAEDWSAQQLDARFDDRSGDDEIAHLGRTLNVLLDRVAGALRGEQRLTSELAHELRTPLTAIRAEAELAAMASPGGAERERLDRIVDVADRMGETITVLLDIARGVTAPDRFVDVGTVLAEVVERRPGDPVPVRTELGEQARVALVAGPAEIVGRALSPLLDNATAYAVAQVVVSGAVHDRVVVVSVTDDGPGVDDAASSDRLFAAGVRGADSGGAGLGLALARRAARSLGGEVALSSSRSPTTFTLTLPRA